tara:strand:+ start:1032 stop:1709 length:678 start_codon:yes stop_codon:yes gene_type:complete
MPTSHQLNLLKEYLIEFYKFQAEYYNDDERMLTFIEKHMKDPLLQKDPEFHRCNLDLLTIEEGFPIAHFNNKNHVYAIQLRSITPKEIKNRQNSSYADVVKTKEYPKKLLLGCGNNPTSVCYHYPTNMEHFKKCCIEFFEEKIYSSIIIDQKEDELEEDYHHDHHDYITIDPHIVMNPTIISEFGCWELPFLPDNYFDCIHSEGIYLENTEFYNVEKNRILKRNF